MPSKRFKGFKVFKGLEGLEDFKGLRAGKRQAWTHLSGPSEAIDVWPWGACWLQDEACQGIVSAAHKKPLMCGLGVAVGCRMKHAKSAF